MCVRPNSPTPRHRPDAAEATHMRDQQPTRLDVDPTALDAAADRLEQALHAIEPREIFRAPPASYHVGHHKLWQELDRFFEECGSAIDFVMLDQTRLGAHLRACAQTYQAAEHTITAEINAAEISAATPHHPDHPPVPEGDLR